MALRLEVLGGFRRLLRVRQIVFEGDDRAINAARLKLREEFLKNKHVTEPTKLATLIKGINEVEEMLRFNVVQGKLNDRGNYEVKMRPEAVQALGEKPSLTPVADPSARAAAGGVAVEQSCNVKTDSSSSS